MKIVFINPVLILHNSYLSDELYKLTNGKFWFIEACKIGIENKIKLPSNFNIYDKPYLLQAWKSEENKKQAYRLIKDADLVMVGGGYDVLLYESIRLKTGKLTFELTERQLKRGILNAFSKTALGYSHMYKTIGHNNVYRLCLSAYTANDMYLLHPFLKGKCYKFGYFTQAGNLNIDNIIKKREKEDHVKIFWSARLLKLKRPDLPVLLAKKLKDKGYDFEINMAGDGEQKSSIIKMIKHLNLENYVKLLGHIPNEQVLELMKEHDIFIFTSNKREGWGAVLNEAMSCGCCCIASDLIGATNYLIKDGANGIIFKTGNINDLTKKIISIIEDPIFREKIQRQAYRTMVEIWNPQVAAINLCRLAESLINKTPIIIEEGPCSLAEPIKGKTLAF